MGNCGSVEKKENPLKETIADHDAPINCLALSEDGTILVTGSEDATARMWSITTPETDCLGVFVGHASYVNAVVIVGGMNTNREEEEEEEEEEDGDHRSPVEPDAIVLTGAADNTIRKWSAYTCECLFVYEGHNARIMKLFVTGDQVVSSSYDSTVKVWSLKTAHIPTDQEGDALLRSFEGHGKGVYPMIFIPSEVLKAAEENNNSGGGSENNDPFGLAVEKQVTFEEPEQDDLLITGSADMTARAWEFNSAKCLRIFKGHAGAVTTMSVDAAGKVLFTAGADSFIKSWVVATGQLIRTMDGHNSSILSMLVYHRLMYTGGADMMVKCWTKDFGDCTKTYRGHKHSVICLSLSMGNLFTGCGDGMMRAYNATTGELKATFEGHEGAINCMVVLKDKVYTGASDCTLRCWDIKELMDDLLFALYEEPVVEQAVTEEPGKDEEEGSAQGEEEEDGVVAVDDVEFVNETEEEANEELGEPEEGGSGGEEDEEKGEEEEGGGDVDVSDLLEDNEEEAEL